MRVWVKPDAHYGEPWDWVCLVVRHPTEEATAVLAGAKSAPPVSAMHEVAEKLKAGGFKFALLQRIKGRKAWKRFNLETLQLEEITYDD